MFQFDKFITTVNRNLVDSNMFIRSLVLSLEHFQNEEEIAKGKSLMDSLTFTLHSVISMYMFLENHIHG